MEKSKNIFYVGYGSSYDPRMIEAITGAPAKVIGNVTIQDVELCAQSLSQISSNVEPTAPIQISPKQIIERVWGDSKNFESYAIRPRKGSAVRAKLYEISQQARETIADWELVDFGWYDRMTVIVNLPDGSRQEAQTEGFTKGQDVQRVIDGLNYELFLVNTENMYKIAKEARALSYFARIR